MEFGSYPTYSRAERRADAVLHALGVTFAITGTVLLLVFAIGRLAPGTVAGLSVYGGALILSFVASAFYHFTPWEQLRPTFRRIDQAAIYLKIAGTYTPLVILIGSAFAYWVLGLVWAVALAGATVKLFMKGQAGRWAAFAYLGLGWTSLALVWSLFPLLPVAASILIVVAGVLYSIGVGLFYWGNLRFEAAIWHSHVLTASMLLFISITLGAFHLG